MNRFFANPRLIQPTAPTIRDIVNIGFLYPFVSAMVPNIGPIKATTRVAIEAAFLYNFRSQSKAI